MVTEDQRLELARLAESANEKLAKAGAGTAEQSFGLGCVLVVVPVGIAVLILYILGALNLISGTICLIGGILGLIGVVTFMSYQARLRGVAHAYSSEVEPEITASLEQSGLSRQELALVADEVLPSDAPLRAYLPLPPAQEPPDQDPQDRNPADRDNTQTQEEL